MALDAKETDGVVRLYGRLLSALLAGDPSGAAGPVDHPVGYGGDVCAGHVQVQKKLERGANAVLQRQEAALRGGNLGAAGVVVCLGHLKIEGVGETCPAALLVGLACDAEGYGKQAGGKGEGG